MRYVDYEKRDAIAIIRMNRPDRGNALGSDMVTDLLEALANLKDDDDARVAVLTGTDQFFCGGLDLKQVVETGNPFIDPRAFDLYDPPGLTKPIVGAINGWAVGAGMIVALEATELRVMAEDAVMGMWEIKRGYPARWQYRLTHSLTPAETAEIVYGLDISAQRALEMGLVNRVVPRDRLMEAAMEMAEYMVSLPPMAIGVAKELIRKATPSIPADLWEYAEGIRRRLVMSEDGMEGIRAFVEKRKPEFKELL